MSDNEKVTPLPPVGTDPIELFKATRELARGKGEPWDATAAALGTVDGDGMPQNRFVLVKEVDHEGFYFYTNYQSAKGRELALSPKCSIAILWTSLDVQFRITGAVEQTSAARSDAYFASRPRESQIGAWASNQSAQIPDRSFLEERIKHFSEKFDGADVPRPEHWGGYRVEPKLIEYWVGHGYRIHDRHLYRREQNGIYQLSRLAP